MLITLNDILKLIKVKNVSTKVDKGKILVNDEHQFSEESQLEGKFVINEM